MFAGGLKDLEGDVKRVDVRLAVLRCHSADIMLPGLLDLLRRPELEKLELHPLNLTRLSVLSGTRDK